MTASRPRFAPAEPVVTSARVPSRETPRRGRRQADVDVGSALDVAGAQPIGASLPDAGGVDTVVDVTAPMLLDLRGIAETLGLAHRTVRNYHQAAERRRRQGAPRPGDFPPPDQVFGRTPVWKASTVRSWKQRRPGRGAGGGRPRKEVNA
jgi:predicted DNA-binding transcriptional regulator AlpA